jgi:hypothetical protein
MIDAVKTQKLLRVTELKNTISSAQTELSALETELGSKQTNDPKPSPAQEFQAERDAKPSPFDSKK